MAAKPTTVPEPRAEAAKPEIAPASPMLIAAEGRTVLAEDGTPWPAAGMEDPQTLFTRRRLADGDLIVAPAATNEETN